MRAFADWLVHCFVVGGSHEDSKKVDKNKLAHIVQEHLIDLCRLRGGAAMCDPCLNLA